MQAQIKRHRTRRPIRVYTVFHSSNLFIDNQETM